MAEDTGGEKSLPASAQKISKAREEGNIAKSQDLNAAWSLAVALGIFWYSGSDMFEGLVESTQFFFGNITQFSPDTDAFIDLAMFTLLRLGRLLLPFCVLMLLAGTTMNVIQTGFVYTPKALAPKFNRLNPISGFKKFFSPRTLVELVKSVLKLVLIMYIVYVAMRDRIDEIYGIAYLTPMGAISGIASLAAAIWLRVVLAMLILGLADFGYQYWQHRQDLRMTVQEAKEEARSMEGDPRIKQRIRQIQRQMAMKRMMAEVPTADVIITNPVRFAVALRYDMDTMAAPVVVAKGARLLAQRIRQIAEENQVPIVEKPELARALFKNIEVGQPVSENLFRAVAEVLSFVYRIDRRIEKRRERARNMSTLAGAR
ncbi:MAG: flagellar biosynthesis protein FlhB [Candidatus Hydrogenedentes bacterium]|nr:flagellar biosynthesis protein FlhB [Candidatus Hydrogenedentota bacterium]